MKKCIIYSVIIYLLLMMYINLHKPLILYDINGNIKSMNYFKYKIKYGFDNMNELICFPTIAIICAIISFILAKILIE
jgi:hypothetical protein